MCEHMPWTYRLFTLIDVHESKRAVAPSIGRCLVYSQAQVVHLQFSLAYFEMAVSWNSMAIMGYVCIQLTTPFKMPLEYQI